MKQSRSINYDVVRTIAIIMVIICHSTEAIYSFNIEEWKMLDIFNKMFMIGSFTIGRLGVPLFLFLTGSLVLKKTFKTNEDVKEFYLHNLLPLLIAHIIWVIIYNIYFLIINREVLPTVYNMIKEILFLKAVPFNHYWYMSMIISTYIAIPFISVILQSFNNRTLKPILIFMFVVGFMIPFFNVFFLVSNINEYFNTGLILVSLGGTYGLYIIAGYIISQKEKIKRSACLIVGFISFIATCMLQAYSYHKGYYIYNVWYDFPLLIISSACLFAFLISYNYERINPFFKKTFKYISMISLFVYFYHFLILKIVENTFKTLELSNITTTLILSVFLLMFCIISSFILKTFKPIRKYVMRIK